MGQPITEEIEEVETVSRREGLESGIGVCLGPGLAPEPVSRPVKKAPGAIWRRLSSMTLALWLFAAVALLSLIGTLIPQNEEPAFYAAKYGASGSRALQALGFTDLYHTGWFVSLMAMLALNLGLCLSKRFVLTKRMAGSLLAHGSILVILAGALIGHFWGKSGFLQLHEGETTGAVISNSKPAELGFSIRLNDFVYEEALDPKERLEVYREDGSFLTSVSSRPGSESQLAGTPYQIRILRYVPDFSMDLTTREVVSRSQEPRNPALEAELQSEGNPPSRFWVFAVYPDVHNPVRDGLKFKYDWRARRPSDFISKLSVIEGSRELFTREVRVNQPLHFKGYSFFQSSYDTEHQKWSGIRVVRDPGVPVVYTGFGMLVAGLILLYRRNVLLRRAG